MIDLTQIFTAIAGIAAGGGFGWILRSNRRQARAMAESAEESAVAGRERRYESTVAFLQQQLKESGLEIAGKTRLIRQQNTEILQLTRDIHELELRYLSSRCDLRGCMSRRPPFPWLTVTDTDKQAHTEINNEK